MSVGVGLPDIESVLVRAATGDVRQAEQLAAVQTAHKAQIAVVFADRTHILVVLQLFGRDERILGYILSFEGLLNSFALQLDQISVLTFNLYQMVAYDFILEG